MLTDAQIRQVWEEMLSAEARSLYFGDLASMYTRRKQWITGCSFFLSSGAAASIIGKAPSIVPVILALIVAGATAYAMAVNLDGKIQTMAKLYSAWDRIGSDYTNLWSHTYEPDAEESLADIVHRAREASELATTEAPNDQKRLGKWQEQVFLLHGLTSQPHVS